MIEWVARNVIPHERDLRVRLRGMSASDQEIDDIVQDAYLSISKLESVAHIQNGRAYFFATARTAILQRVRRERIVRIEAIAEIDLLAVEDGDPGPERRVSARQELALVLEIIEALPARCRDIFIMRRIHRIPQKEIARKLGVTEHIVEAEASRGLKLILKALSDGNTEERSATRERKSKREQQQRK